MKKKTETIRCFLHVSGFAYSANTEHLDLIAHLQPSSAEVLEDGLPLPGLEIADITDISQIGLGRFCFWRNVLYLSTSDNSDPRTNRRTYAIRYTPQPRFSFQKIWLWLGAHLWYIRHRFSLRKIWLWLGTHLWNIRHRFSLWGLWYWICFTYVLCCGNLSKGNLKRRTNNNVRMDS